MQPVRSRQTHACAARRPLRPAAGLAPRATDRTGAPAPEDERDVQDEARSGEAGQVDEDQRHVADGYAVREPDRIAGERDEPNGDGDLARASDQHQPSGLDHERRRAHDADRSAGRGEVVNGAHGSDDRASGAPAASVGLPIVEQAVLECEERDSGPARDADLRVHVLDVVLGGAPRDDEPARDLGVRAALRDQAHDLDLTLAQPGGAQVAPAARPRLPGGLEHRGDAVRVQPPGARVSRAARPRPRRARARPGAAAAASSPGTRRRRRGCGRRPAARVRPIRGGSPTRRAARGASRRCARRARGRPSRRGSAPSGTRATAPAPARRVVSAPGFSQITFVTASRPMSWRQRGHLERARRTSVEPQAPRGPDASAATPDECPCSAGTLRSATSPNAAAMPVSSSP